MRSKQPPIFNQVVLLFWFIFGTLLLFGLIALVIGPMVENAINWPVTHLETLRLTIIVLSLVGIPAGFVFHNHVVKKIPPELPPEKKIEKYRNSFLVKMVLFESLAIIALMGYLISLDISFILIYATLMLAYLTNKPNWRSVQNELNIN